MGARCLVCIASAATACAGCTSTSAPTRSRLCWRFSLKFAAAPTVRSAADAADSGCVLTLRLVAELQCETADELLLPEMLDWVFNCALVDARAQKPLCGLLFVVGFGKMGDAVVDGYAGKLLFCLACGLGPLAVTELEAHAVELEAEAHAVESQ